MKKALLFAAMLICLGTFAQTTTNQTTFCLSPSCPQKVFTTDTAQVFAQLMASDGVKSITFTQASGPNTAKLGSPITAWVSGQQATTSVNVLGTVSGVYVFKVIGSSNGGTIGAPVYDTLTVVQAPPPCPAPRTVIALTFKVINGVWTPSFIYNDGTTQ